MCLSAECKGFAQGLLISVPPQQDVRELCPQTVSGAGPQVAPLLSTQLTGRQHRAALRWHLNKNGAHQGMSEIVAVDSRL